MCWRLFICCYWPGGNFVQTAPTSWLTEQAENTWRRQTCKCTFRLIKPRAVRLTADRCNTTQQELGDLLARWQAQLIDQLPNYWLQVDYGHQVWRRIKIQFGCWRWWTTSGSSRQLRCIDWLVKPNTLACTEIAATFSLSQRDSALATWHLKRGAKNPVSTDNWCRQGRHLLPLAKCCQSVGLLSPATAFSLPPSSNHLLMTSTALNGPITANQPAELAACSTTRPITT